MLNRRSLLKIVGGIGAFFSVGGKEVLATSAIPESTTIQFEPPKILKTGFPAIDLALNGGFRTNELNIVYGKLGDGLSIFDHSLICNLAEKNDINASQVVRLHEIGSPFMSYDFKECFRQKCSADLLFVSIYCNHEYCFESLDDVSVAEQRKHMTVFYSWLSCLASETKTCIVVSSATNICDFMSSNNSFDPSLDHMYCFSASNVLAYGRDRVRNKSYIDVVKSRHHKSQFVDLRLSESGFRFSEAS